MARRPVDRTPYKLSALPHATEVCAMGNYTIMRMLEMMRGAEIRQHPQGRYVAFRATRDSMMAAEAIAAPSFTAPEYIELRREIMAVPVEQMGVWREHAPVMRRPLMRHQEDFCALAYPTDGMLNASEQGTGKTAMAIALTTAWAHKLTLVVCPRGIMRQWQDEWYMTITDMTNVAVIPLQNMDVPTRADVLEALLPMEERIVAIINYDALHGMLGTLLRLTAIYDTAIIFDESWRIKDRATKVARAATQISRNCVHRLALTGTPMGQGIADLWMQLCVIECRPVREMETFKEWCNRYESKIYTGSGTVTLKTCSDPISLMRRLSPVFYRATKASCLDLPPKLPMQRVRFPMPQPMRRIYTEVQRDGEAALGEHLSLMGARTTTLRLQQIVGGFVYNPDGTYTEEEAGQLHDLRLRFIGSPKSEWCMEFANDRLLGDPTHRVIFWCKFNAEVLNNCRRMGRILGENRVVSITKDTTDDELERIMVSFNSRDEDGVQVIWAQIKKVAYGGNWQAGDTHIYYSHTWSHVEKSQSGDRSHRIGRTAPVAMYELVMSQSVDENVLASTDSLQDFHERYTPDTTIGIQPINI